MSTELSEYDVLLEEYVRLHGAPPPRKGLTNWPKWSELSEGDRPRELARLYAALHAGNRKALSLSGGGIRSATFALGIIQRLAELGILSEFDYLSTVSGGGYIGGWLSSYVRRSRNGVSDVQHELQPTSQSSVKPEAEPVTHLRDYSNYLTPKLGALSADTWAIAGTYLRNLTLNWLVLIPLLVALLAVPRLFIGVLHWQHPPFVGTKIATVVLFLIALFYLAFARPVNHRLNVKPWRKALASNDGFLALCALPLTLAAAGMAALYGWQPHLISTRSISKYTFGTSVSLSIVYMIRFFLATRTSKRIGVRRDSTIWRYAWKKFAFEVGAAALSACVLAALVHRALLFWYPNPTKMMDAPDLGAWMQFPPALDSSIAASYVTFGVPVILLALFLQATVFVGFSSWFNEDYDREWWARAGGWILIVTVMWIAVTGITIFGPVLLYLAPRTAAALGLGSGALSLGAGWGANTAANAKEKTGDTKEKASNISLGFAVPLFAICFLAFLSLVTSKIIAKVENIAPAATPHQIAIAERSSWKVELNAPAVYPGTKPGNVRKGDWKLETQDLPAIDTPTLAGRQHLWIVEQSKPRLLLGIILGGLALSMVGSYFIGVNKFSMNAMYRNRLIRAYLGASKKRRVPNPFTGFDPDDNVQMHKLRAEMVWPHAFDFRALREALTTAGDGTLAKYVYDQLPARTKRMLADGGDTADDGPDAVADDLNTIIDGHVLASRRAADADELGPALSWENRRLLDEALGDNVLDGLQRLRRGRPMHVVNMALNLVGGSELAWQERKAESFAVTPLHSGASRLGYRRSNVYGGASGISLGTAVSISGAAVSPNMGYHSSPAVSFLLTLFNVRLGWWLGNPGPNGEATYRNDNPKPLLRKLVFQPLIGEALGMTDDKHPYVYLSDGGHFENLGLYEMVRRRCHWIVLSDAGSDENFAFDDLGNAIRKIRIDFGIEVRIRHMGIYPRNVKDPKEPKYCAVADILYKAVDGPDAVDGHLVYIKPAFYGTDEPKDIYNYATANATFPHETTGDQFFSESQFESYRRLGQYAAKTIAGKPRSVEEFVNAAMAYTAKEDAKKA